jgi:predicted DsbA family dithiol-disulfide isomerase
MSMSETLHIDIISDVMCPWCIIGYRQLSQALEATGTAHEIHWHPFELNPDMPAEGQNTREHIIEKYGSTPAQSEQARQQMKALGDDLGFEFAWSEDSRMHNTFNTHQLLHWANTLGQMHALKQALFAAHFTAQRDLSDDGVLADVAAEIGLDRTEAAAVLDEQRYADDVRRAEQFWQQQGITGVPAVVFDRKHLVTGAQGVDTYTNILAQLAEMKG